jgi:hypothetical protein
MNQSLFRKKSIDRVSSPEQLNEYIKVANPGVWMVLTAIIVLLAGVVVWGCIGHLETTLPVAIVSDGGEMVIYVKEADVEKLELGMAVRAEGQEFTITQIAAAPIRADATFPEYALHLGNFVEGEWVYAVRLGGALADGVYKAEIVTERISPISFLLN